MNQTIEEKNKELVLRAFDTLFNKRDYAAASATGRPTTFNIALISNPAATAYSSSSKASRRR